MREVAGADISVINQGAFELGRSFPLEGTISRVDLYQILRFPNRLVRIEVSGAELSELIDADPGDDAGKRDLHWVGLDVRDGKILVNGRPLDQRLTYSLVTNEFLARGGDETFSPMTGTVPMDAKRNPLLREHVERWLERRGSKPLGNPASAFVDLWDKPLWTLGVQGKFDFSA